MQFVQSLYRHPVKGFTPERRESLVVGPDGRVVGDRVLALRFADAATPEDRDGLDHWPKSRGLALVDFPSLARLHVAYDEEPGRLRVADEADVLAEDVLDEAGRERISEAVAAWVLDGPDARRLRGEGRLPLRLVGDGATARFQDRPRGFVSLHAAASVAALDAAVDAPVDDRRFRSNIVIGGTDAWAELSWAGGVTIGAVAFRVQGPIGRCLAIHANPDTGERDAGLLRILTREFAQAEPTLGILLLPEAAGGEIRVGDPVRLG
ncbi:hypothetical protein ASD19_11735 [Microbacterium sp. Root53]|uniref:MOSC domain-containing protein n=1 Tax=Microbacterium sp. Root53 TaxID=1736553 RepID=UPI0006F38C56|nr:MOSC domain-containing protein [Microbacterium sp. Root53]KQZ07894.1 hypothetical protein ASD19_11735 [Microbacterium sp. Root53]